MVPLVRGGASVPGAGSETPLPFEREGSWVGGRSGVGSDGVGGTSATYSLLEMTDAMMATVDGDGDEIYLLSTGVR